MTELLGVLKWLPVKCAVRPFAQMGKKSAGQFSGYRRATSRAERIIRRRNRFHSL